MNPVNTKPYHLPEDAVWLVTGCSSGIGRALCEFITTHHATHRLVATARNVSALSYLPSSPNILALQLDVTSPSSVSAAFTAIKDKFNGRLDVVVNNAGYSLSGDTEAATEEETHAELETLFFGAARVSMKAVEMMRPKSDEKEGEGEEARGGLVMNISSLAGLVGLPGHAYYHAGKWALEGWTESVAREMSPDWGISFCLIEPSGVKTSFETHSKARIAPHPAYQSPNMPSRILESYVQKGISSGVGMMSPDAVAEALYHVASRGEKVPLRVPLGSTAWMMAKMKHENALKDLEAVKDLSERPVRKEA